MRKYQPWERFDLLIECDAPPTMSGTLVRLFHSMAHTYRDGERHEMFSGLDAWVIDDAGELHFFAEFSHDLGVKESQVDDILARLAGAGVLVEPEWYRDPATGVRRWHIHPRFEIVDGAPILAPVEEPINA